MIEMDAKQLTELLNKNWMTHDAMWFLHCMQECGMEKTNKINRAAVRSMAMIEAMRLSRALGMEKVANYEDFKKLFQAAADLVMPDFMKFSYSFLEDGVIHAEWQSCFAHDGMKKIGMIDQYECGIFERIEGWLDALKIHYTVSPLVQGCMMHNEGQCYRDYRLQFD